MKHYTVKSKLPSNTIIPIIENNTSSYMLSKVVSDNLMLCKIESNNCFDLFYTGKKLRGHSLYWIQAKIINDNNSCILQLQKKLRTDMKYMYYYIPMVFWLIGILLLFKSVFLTSVYKGYKQDKIEMRGDRAEMSDFPLYLNTVAGGLDCRDQTIGGFSFVVKIYAVPVVEIIG